MQQCLKPLVGGDRLAHRDLGDARDIGEWRLPERVGRLADLLDLPPVGVVGDHEQSGDHPGERRVDARFKCRYPDDEADGQIGTVAPEAHPRQHCEDAEPGDHHRERDQVDRFRIDGADHRDGDDVVDDGEGQQEDPQLGRAATDYRQRPEQEGGVGGDDDAPARGGVAAAVDQEEGSARHRRAKCRR